MLKASGQIARSILRVFSTLAIVILAIMAIVFFWPSLLMFIALYGVQKKARIPLTDEEEIGAVVIVFILSFIWWLFIGAAICNIIF